ncbi:uncharacterized protein [Hemitrygon akajei]|uniref:uncharacterized protein n=1 Tax=Hemitrygon akajei TaxID=2704970 RepID=UPI003BFA05AD
MTFDLLNFILTPVIPFLLVFLTNGLTVRHVLVTSRGRRRLRCADKCQNARDPEMESRRKSLVLLLIISGNFVLLWATYTVYSTWLLLLGYYTSTFPPEYLRDLGSMLQLLSCCTNTALYAVTQTKFREQLRIIIKCPVFQPSLGAHTDVVIVNGNRQRVNDGLSVSDTKTTSGEKPQDDIEQQLETRTSHGNVKIPETTVPFFHCSTWSPGWLKVTDSALGDPCVNHSVLDQPWRRMHSPSMSEQCMSDQKLEQGWYRFSSSGRWKIPETAVPQYCCCGKRQGWLEGSHPTVTEGEVMRNVCFTENGNTITESGMSGNSKTCLDIKIKNCIGYFVYLLKPTSAGRSVYCADSTLGDPCVNHTILDQPWRSTDCSSEKCSNYMNDETRTEGWYRFKSSGGWRIPETVIPPYKCSGTSPGWLNGSHPSVGEGEVNRTVCFSYWGNNCSTKRTIKIKNCGAFFVYWLKPTHCCNKVYCTDPASVPTLHLEGTTPEPSDDFSTITDTETSSDPICVPTPQPKGTSAEPSNDLSTITDPDSRSDAALEQTPQPEETTAETSNDLSMITDPDTSSDEASITTPQTEGTTPESSDDLTMIMDTDTSSDPTSVPTPQPEGTTPEPSDDLSMITDPDTSSGTSCGDVFYADYTLKLSSNGFNLNKGTD